MNEPKLQTKTMDSKHKEMKMNEDTDRLSSLPDELIHKILSLVNMREAIGTSALSPRWRFVWTSMPHLNFSSEGFPTFPKFSIFIRHVMSRLKARNNLTKVHSVKLIFWGKATPSQFKRIFGYVLSHNIQQLDVLCVLVNGIQLTLPCLSSMSLKHLSLTKQDWGYGSSHILYHVDGSLTSTLELPMLTTLDLHSVTFSDDSADKCIDVFSKFVNLKNLTLTEFEAKDLNGFNISHPQLTNLTLKNSHYTVKVVNVVAPHLKNLIISYYDAKLAISAPDLATLIYKNCFALHLATDGFPFLESAHLCLKHSNRDEDAQEMVCLFQQLQSVKFLTLSLEIVELLSSSVGLVLPQPSLFGKLKILKIYPENLQLYESTAKKLALSTELKSYLLDGSPGATLTMVLREEIMAHKCMDELGLLLEKEKDTTMTSRADLDSGKRQILIPESKKLKVGAGSTAHTKSYLEKLGVEIEKARLFNSKLQSIEKLLIKLPESHRAKLQLRFSSLSAETDVAISKIMIA